MPDLDDDEDDKSYVPSEPNAEMEYELPDPGDDGDDPDDDDAPHTEIQGVDTENLEQEPTMIGDGALPIAIHPMLEDVIAQPIQPETLAAHPMELAITTPLKHMTDPSLGEVVNEVTAATPQ